MVQAVIATTVTGLQGRQVAATPAPTNNQALIWNGTAWVPGGPYLTAAGAPYVTTNYCDNSGFTLNQRGYTSGTALAAGAYGFDRWKAGASGCTLTFTPSPGSTVVTIAAGTLQQVIEGVGLINSSYTLSWLGSATGRVNTGAYVASPITFTGAPNTNVTIEFQGGTLGQVQLQIGTQVTLWQPLPPAIDLERCQRFYQTGYGQLWGYASAPGGWLTYHIPYNTPMRANPSLTLSQGSNVNTSPVTIGGITNIGAVLGASVTATGNANWSCSFTLSADL